ncbi:hypothetical protein [Candidatus Nucleicultrix amoebiphila]|jgi:hypothetical protein|uniref:Uncharacterized protein n=1 Tax=Candidatus Nucleicultrix amoebiphila FS5 TaxID=1414854 RepID=A0A1W6N507_9PROT|nr:hypothetical protein [Candidatus Nucleicultrix amoebiphila]ARN84954.1 hypothetical protein GQ61_06270 [Candidatus Nucleicultrix amoebiphila FS5]
MKITNKLLLTSSFMFTLAISNVQASVDDFEVNSDGSVKTTVGQVEFVANSASKTVSFHRDDEGKAAEITANVQKQLSDAIAPLGDFENIVVALDPSTGKVTVSADLSKLEDSDRSVAFTVNNYTSRVLTLNTTTSLCTLGQWCERMVPDDIQPESSGHSAAKSNTLLKGVEGTLTYDLSDGAGTASIGFSNPFIGKVKYTINAPNGFEISVSGGGGNNATPVFSLRSATLPISVKPTPVVPEVTTTPNDPQPTNPTPAPTTVDTTTTPAGDTTTTPAGDTTTTPAGDTTTTPAGDTTTPVGDTTTPAETSSAS